MPLNDPQSPVLIDQASPFPSAYSPELSSPRIPAISHLLNELTSVESNEDSHTTTQPQASAMDNTDPTQEPSSSTMNVPREDSVAPDRDDRVVELELRSPVERSTSPTMLVDVSADASIPILVEVVADNGSVPSLTDSAHANEAVGSSEMVIVTATTGESAGAASTQPADDSAQDSEMEDSGSTSNDDVPSWVKYEEDNSYPDEGEMKEIEASEYDKLSALDITAMEEQFFTDVDDPDQRPVKKLRLSWVIRGVRGTTERPNFARVMNSPGACIDGLYWSVKFYPRGDQCSSLSAFVRCSREPPPIDEECPDSDFSVWESSPEVNFSVDSEPNTKLQVSAKIRPKPELRVDKVDSSSPEETKKQTNTIEAEDTPLGTDVSAKDTINTPPDKAATSDLPSWRVAAQLGMAIYNPIEPRTGHLQSDGHQFSKHCDDWGWVNFVGPWDEIHRRKRGQRQALLRNDTLAIDAYIRIFNDPTGALWWHESKDETQWPSKELAGYFPMGTPGLYHSPAVAGITAWMLLSPFRDIIQSADGGQWRTDSNSDPKPLICNSQLALDQMRNLSSDCYVNLYKIIEEFVEADEQWNDVKSFWEVFRRGLELELSHSPEALEKISAIFDAEGSRWKIPSLPVPGTTSFQQGMGDFCETTKYQNAMPDVMSISLNRSEFDTTSREWKLHHDRVRLNDELDMSKWCTNSDPRYTLYGFVVHVGARNSGKFYSILRPGGIGTKWLAFEDGNGNKIFSYSRRRIQDFEGLEGEELRNFPAGDARENASLAIYIRTSYFRKYVPESLEAYRVPKWLKPWADYALDDDDNGDDDYGDDDYDDGKDSQVQEGSSEAPASKVKKREKSGIQIELYLDECAEGCENMLRLHDLRTAPVAKQLCRTVTVAVDKTFKELRCAIAQAFEVSDYSRVKLLEVQYQNFGKFSRAILERISYRTKIVKEAIPGYVFRIWVSVQQPVGGKISYKGYLDRLEHLGLAEKTVQDDDDNLIETNAERLASMIDGTMQVRAVATVSLAPSIEEVGTASPDAEQASIQAAVNVDLELAGLSPDIHRNNVDVADASPASMEQGENSEGEDGMLTPTSSARSVSRADGQTESLAEPAADELARPVVHGHLVDAAEHADDRSTVSITHITADVASGHAEEVEQIDAEEFPAVDEPQQAEHNNENQEDAAVEVERESQSCTPTQIHVPRCYGNIQIFDTERQAFIAQRPFHPELEMEIAVAVRKQMQYNEERQFKIWRRQGVVGTESLQPDVTFSAAGLSDVFTIIVGDVLSEAKVDELKAAGQFWQPSQLISYLGMTRRKHPYAALSSSEPVELADVGKDFYRGPLSRGRPHGEQGCLITSSGHTYTGPFVAGQKSGPQGRMIYQNGDTYVGEWLNDERHGRGEYIEKRTGNRYIGGFENGKRWGQGTTYWQVADQQADMCQICYEEEIDALFYDCGHVCACVACAKQCETCPICRRTVRQVVKMWRA